MTGSPQTQHIVVLDPSEVPAARALAALQNVEVEEVPRRGIEPVVTVTLILVGAVTAVGAVVHVLEQHKGGQVIDLRPGAPKAFYRTPEVVFGTVVIIAEDGKVTVEVKEPEGMFGKVISILPELLSGGADSAEQIAQTVTAMFDSEVEVETVEIPPPAGER
ncbi:hypothetical protein [Streptosporangium lutulentum]|uniref:Uncharacterized protein n=1 Tax=Streptosporangium lutulentum TaxID=1461250 RepID=A0ABT9Q5W4_9ACTN|nr:hypothetical protein [Streptosporangium lutulentum]MDP9842140.1 hypothetical protein [Streptosporangium lutulentum]